MAYGKLKALIERVNPTTTSGGTLTLANNSPSFQRFTGSSNHTVTLPQANAAAPNECPNNLKFIILNRSTGTITVNYYGGSLAVSVAANTQTTLRLMDNTTSAGTWDITVEAAAASSATLTSNEKLSSLAALASANYQDSESNTVTISPNLEEIAGDYWTTKTSASIAGRADAFSLNGFLYRSGSSGTSAPSTAVASVERFNDDTNSWGSKTAMPVIAYDGTAIDAIGYGYHIGGYNSSGVASLEGYKYNDTTDSWSQIAAALTKYGYQASAYASGYINLVGGTQASISGATNTIQQYDPTLNAYYLRVLTASIGRIDSSSFVLSDRHYCAGGQGSDLAYKNTTDIFDYVMNALIIGPTLLTARLTQGDSSVGCGFTISGYNGSFQTTCERLDTVKGAWVAVTAIGTARRFDGAGVKTLNGSVYAVAGQGSSYVSTLSSYLPVSFFPVGISKKSKTSPSTMFVAAALNNIVTSLPARIRTDGDNWKYVTANADSVLKSGETFSKFVGSNLGYVHGGNDGGTYQSSEAYISESNTWLTKTASTLAAQTHGSFKSGGKAYSFGGTPDGFTTYQGTAQYYDSITNAWSNVSAFTGGVVGSASGFSLNDVGYACLGYNNVTVLSNVFKFVSNAWVAVTAATSARNLPSAFSLNGFGWLTHGSSTNAAANVSTVVQSYNPDTNTWATKSGTALTARQSGGSASFEGSAYVYGGDNGSGILNSPEKYNPVTDQWSSITSMGTSRGARPGAFLLQVGIYAAGGNNAGRLATTEQYNPYANVWTGKGNLNTARTFTSTGFTPAPYYSYELQIGLPTYLASLGGGQWITKTAMPIAKTSGGSFTIGSSIYCSDGNGGTQQEHQKYDPVTDSFMYETNFPYANQECYSMNLAVNGLGHRFGDGAAATNQLHYRYEPLLKNWLNSTQYPTLIYQQSAGCLNGLLYGFAGNRPGTGLVTTNYSYSDITDSWTSKATTLSTSQDSPAGSYNGFLYATGSSRHDQYNDAGNSWLAKTGLGYSGNQSIMFLSQNKLVVCGGGTPVTTVQWYNDGLNAWVALTPLPGGRGGAFNASHNDTGYVIAGSNGVGNQTTNYAYTPTVKNVVLGAALRVN